MDPQIQSVLIGSGIAVISAVAGYAIREWRNQSRPFIEITGFEGELSTPMDIVEISEDIQTSLKNAFRIRGLTNLENLENISLAVAEAKEIEYLAPSILQRIDDLIKLIDKEASDEDIYNNLANLLEIARVDYYLFLLLMNNSLKPANYSPELPIKLNVHPSLDNDGSFVIGFPGKPVIFGFNTQKEVYVREIFQSFINQIQYLDRQELISTFNILKTQINNENLIAKEILPKLENILNESSLWEVRVYVANLRSTPIMIEPRAYLHVKDKTNAKFLKECNIVTYKELVDGTISKTQTNIPLIVESGGNISFSFVTKETQKEMERGPAFRDAFSNKKAEAWLQVTIRGVGLIKRRSIETRKEIFGEST